MNQSEITRFIKFRLGEKLGNDLRNLRIVKEADIECSIYFHLRKYLGEKSEWRLLARKHTRATRHYIDLLLFDREIPVIAIEIKWAKRAITKKDRDSLEKAIGALKVKRAYWISMVLDEKTKKSQKSWGKLEEDKYKLFPIVIPLGLSKEKRKVWKKNRRLYMRDMKSGGNA